MFDDIGEKIKSLAYAVFCVGIISSIIYGFVMAGTDENLILLGFVIIIAGSLISLMSSYIIYGFGQLIENTDQLVQNAKVSTTNKLKNYQENKKRTVNKNNSKQKTLSKDFVDEIKNTSTEDLQLIFEDQRDLYSTDEIDFIEQELFNR